MKEIFWIVTFFITILFAVLKKNADDWSLHNQCILLWCILLEVFLIIYFYTKNIIKTKKIIEIVAMYQTVFQIFAIDIVIGLFISYTYTCVFYVIYNIIFIY